MDFACGSGSLLLNVRKQMARAGGAIGRSYGPIDTVIDLPANLFYSTGIPMCILVLKSARSQTMR